MSFQIVTLAVPLIVFVGSLTTILWTTKLALQKERRQLLWSKELDRFFALEERAGQLVEELGSYGRLDQAKVSASLGEFRRVAGSFVRYPGVRQAIRDLQNTLDRMFIAKQDYEDDQQELRAELEVRMKQLLAACDQVTERKSVWRLFGV
jgi:hypothetical protein